LSATTYLIISEISDVKDMGEMAKIVGHDCFKLPTQLVTTNHDSWDIIIVVGEDQ